MAHPVFDFNTPITADITLYPKWTVNSYTVSFVSNGGSTVVDQTVNYGSKATSPVPTKAGSTLVGWYSDVDLTVVFDFNTAITANTTLYAKWSLNSYTVSFNSTGGSAVDPQSVVYNNSATRPVSPVRAGYSFINWYTDLNLTTVFDFTTKITADTVLYAKWANTLSYDGNGGTGAVPAPSTHTQPDTVALPSTPGDLVRTGFTFIGWNTDRSANTKLDTVVVSGPTTVYAIWMTTLSYDGNGNSGGSTPAGASYPSSALVTVSGNTGVLTKADYLFSGWDKVVGDTVTPVYEGQTFSITGITVLRARWVKNTAAARFINNNNGTVTDTLTGFVWLKDAGCVGRKTLADAKTAVGALASGACATTDGSVAGDWHLPTLAELKSLVDSAATVSPPLPTGHPFTGVQISGYWSSLPANSGVNMEYGVEFTDNIATHAYYVWPVRGGQVVGTDITTDATEVAYSSVIVNTGSTRLLTITNSGTTRLQVDGMAISGSDAAQFVLNTATGNCGVTPILAPNGSCTVSITFTPATLGAKTATLRIVSGAVRTPVVDINLTGTGVATPVDGVCGTSNGAAFEFKPTTGLCTAGTASDPSGSGPWNWTCSGSAGGATASCSARLIVNTPPVLSVSTLSNGAWTKIPTLNVAGTATAANILKSVTVNGMPVTVATADGSFSQAITLISGANIVTTVATDTVNKTTTDTRTINLDSTAPALAVSTPADNSATNQSFVTILGTVSDVNLDTVYAKIGSTVLPAAVSGNNFAVTVYLAVGQNNISIIAADLVGNTTEVKRTVTYDTAKPALAVTDPTQDVTITSKGYLLKGTVSGQGTTVTVTVDGTTNYSPTVSADGTFQQQLTFTAEKTYAIEVKATSAAGNVTTVPRNIIYSASANGDVNGDGVVDIADALLALRISVGLEAATVDYIRRGDVAPLVNGKPAPDGFIDVGDVQLILRRIVGLVTW